MPGLPSLPRLRLPAGARLTVEEWRSFGDRRYRPFQGIGVGSAAVFALAGDGLTIPLLLALGAPAALATVIGVLPFTFSAAQLLVPSLLLRTDGNLRGVTMAILAVGETRGFVLAGIVLLHVLGLFPAGVAIAGVAAVMSLGGAASAIGGANLLAWYGAILPEPERRFVAPRVMGITQGLGATSCSRLPWGSRRASRRSASPSTRRCSWSPGWPAWENWRPSPAFAGPAASAWPAAGSVRRSRRRPGVSYGS